MSFQLNIKYPVERIFIWGMMGVGKTTRGRKLASNLGWKFIDMDQRIQSKTGKRIHEIFHSEGEDQFRAMEKAELESLLSEKNVVIAVGGGTPCFHGLDDEMLKYGLCVWLDARPKFLLDRLANAKVIRPLLEGLSTENQLAKLETLLEKRKPHFRRAHLIFQVAKMTPRDLVSYVRLAIVERS